MKNPQEEKLKYAEREVDLARAILASDPDNQLQKDRLAYWSLVLDDLDTAKEHGTSEKLQGLIADYERRNSV